MSAFTFPDRNAAGSALAAELARYRDRNDLVVLALPRGGVPVGYEIARALHAPLDVFLVRKLGVPGSEELAMGAIASGGTQVFNENVVRQLRITREQMAHAVRLERQELERRELAFRNDAPPAAVQGRVCLLVDDGLATGSTMRAAVEALRRLGPAQIIIAVPVGASDTCAELQPLVDEVVCLYMPEPFMAVGRWYEDFSQLTDNEVRESLARAAHEMAH